MKQFTTSNVTGFIAIALIVLVFICYFFIYNLTPTTYFWAEILVSLQVRILPTLMLAALVLGIISISTRKKRLPGGAIQPTVVSAPQALPVDALQPEGTTQGYIPPPIAPTQAVIVNRKKSSIPGRIPGLLSVILGSFVALYVVVFFVLVPLFSNPLNTQGSTEYFGLTLTEFLHFLALAILLFPAWGAAFILGLVSISSAKRNGQSRALGAAGLGMVAVTALIVFVFGVYFTATGEPLNSFLASL